MKIIDQITDEEKIKKFDEIHQSLIHLAINGEYDTIDVDGFVTDLAVDLLCLNDEETTKFVDSKKITLPVNTIAFEAIQRKLDFKTQILAAGVNDVKVKMKLVEDINELLNLKISMLTEVNEKRKEETVESAID